MTDESVGSIVGYIRLNADEWDTTTRRVERKADELGRLAPTITVKASTEAAIAKMSAVAAAAGRLATSQDRISESQTRYTRSTEKLTEAQKALAEAQKAAGGVATKQQADAIVKAANDVERAEQKVRTAHSALAKSSRDAEVAQFGLAAAYTKSSAAADKATAATAKAGKTAGDSARSVSLLGTAAAALGPAIIPLGVVAAASFGAVATGAGVALLAVKGIQAEMKAGTVLGKAYSQSFAGVRSDLAGLEHTAAVAAQPAVFKAVGQMHALMPELNAQTKTYTGLLGDAAGHVVHGLGGGFTALQPLFTTLLRDAVKLSAAFDHYANGGGLAKFGAYVQANLPGIEHDIEAVAETVAHLLEAGAGQGVAVLNTLGLVAQAINAIPLDDLKLLVPLVTDVYLGFQGWKFIANTVNTATKALEGFTAANKASAVAAVESSGAAAVGATAVVGEARAVRVGQRVASSTGSLTAGVAASRVAGGIGTAASTVATLAIPAAGAAVALVGLRVAFDTLKHAQGDYVHSGDQAAAVLKQIAQQGQVTSSDVAHLGGGVTDFGSTIRSAFGEDSKSAIATLRDLGSSFAPFSTQGEKAKTAVKSLDNGLTTLASSGQKGAREAFKFLTDESAKLCIPIGTLLKQFPQYAKTLNQSGLSMKQLKNANLTTVESYADLSSKIGLSAQQVHDYAALVGVSSERVTKGALVNAQLAATVEKVAASYRTATETGSGFLDALNSFAQATAGDTFATAAQTAGLIGASLKAANGDALGFASTLNASATASSGFADSIRQAAKSVGKGGESTKAFLASVVDLKTGTIDYAKSAAAPLISGLQSIQSAGLAAAQATYQHARATLSGKDAADQAYKVYKAQTGPQLDDAFRKLGLNSGAAQKLTDRYLGLPKNVKTLIEQEGADPVVTLLGEIGKQLSYLTGHPWNPKLDVNTAAVHAKVGDVIKLVNGLPKRITTGFYADTAPGKAEVAKLRAAIAAVKQGRVPGIAVNTHAGQVAIAAMQAGISAVKQRGPVPLYVNPKRGFTESDRLQAAINALKQGRAPFINVNTHLGQVALAGMREGIASLKGRNVPVGATDTASPKVRNVIELVNGIPKHVYISVSTSGVGAAVHALSQVRAAAATAGFSVNVAQARGFAGGGMVKAYAAGGMEQHTAQIARTKPGTVRVWAEPETQGESYIPHARDARRPRAHQIMAQTAGILGGHYTPFAQGGVTGNAAYIAQQLASVLGLGRTAIAGVLGNLQVESNFNPRASNPREGAIGIAQFEGSRRTELEAFARDRGESYRSLKAQTAFLISELRGGYRSALSAISSAKSARSAASAFDRLFEVSSGSTRAQRESNATAIYGQLGGKGTFTVGGIQYASASAAHNAQVRAAAADAAAAHAAQVANSRGYYYGGTYYANRTERGTARSAAVNPYTSPVIRRGSDFVYGGQAYSTRIDAQNARIQAEQAFKQAKAAQVAAKAAVAAARVQQLAGERATGASAGNSYLTGLGLGQQVQRDTSDFGHVLGAVSRYQRDQGRNPSAALATLGRENVALAALVKTRGSLTAQLANATNALATVKQNRQTEYQGIKGAVLGSFNIAGAGYGDSASLIAVLRGKVGQAKQFEKDLRTAARHGAPKDMIQALYEAGPDAGAVSAHTLATATHADLKTILGLDRSLGYTAYRTGATETNALYKTGVASAEGLVHGLLSKQNSVNKAAKKLADGIVATIRKELGIKSPSTVMRGHGRSTAEGFALGITDHLPAVKLASSRLAGAALPASGGGNSNRPAVVVQFPETLTVRIGDREFEAYVEDIASHSTTGALNDVTLALNYGPGGIG